MAYAEAARVRLSLDVSAQVNAELDQLARSADTTKSDILRKAIALMSVAVEAKTKGQKLGLLDQDRALVAEIVGL